MQENSAVNRPFSYNYQELIALDIEKPAEVVQGLICERQNVILVGRYGIGKTMLGIQLSLSLASGRDFIGRKILRPYKVAIIDCENDLGDVKVRASKQHEALGLTAEDDGRLRQNWHIATAADLESELHGITLDNGKFEPLKKYVHEVSPDILIIDNLGLVTAKGDLKETEDVKRFYEGLKELRRETKSLQNGVVIVMHHLTKPGENSSTENISLLNSPDLFLARARGSGRVLDFAQGRLALGEDKIGNERLLVVNGIVRSTTRPVPLVLQFNQEGLIFEQNENPNLRFDAIFTSRPRGKQIYLTLPDEFTWKVAEQLRDQNGRPFNKSTLNETLKISVSNDFIAHHDGVYRKIFHPQDGRTDRTVQ